MWPVNWLARNWVPFLGAVIDHVNPRPAASSLDSASARQILDDTRHLCLASLYGSRDGSFVHGSHRAEHFYNLPTQIAALVRSPLWLPIIAELAKPLAESCALRVIAAE